MSSPFLCVFGDDRVTCHTGANVVSSGASDAKSWRGASLGSFIDYI